MLRVKIKDIITAIEEQAPSALQEPWDNAGLLVGNPESEIASAVISLDVTESVIDDAIAHGDGLIIAHHPVIFGGLKRLTGKTESERVVIKAVQHNIAIYAAHTNIDVITNGVSWRMAQKLGLQNIKILVPQKGLLKKLVVFVPTSHVNLVRNAIFEAGAGQIGNYDSCSFNIEGKGSFRAGEQSSPYAGTKGELHFENETRIETIFPSFTQYKVIAAMLKAHPYEEVAYDIYSLDNEHNGIGLGVVGEIAKASKSSNFMNEVKEAFACKVIKHTPLCKDEISKVALVGGAGSCIF
jgi:dinuclear metal center YbgI/SA1388 family protein